jgi:glucosamine 6-phosphate synthetase-like amidotransferase/phosphosugar isomerase protein
MNDGEPKIKQVFESLKFHSSLYLEMNKRTEAKAVIEETYEYVSISYHPEHPLVLEAGGKLIEILYLTGDYYDAERFARVIYDKN